MRHRRARIVIVLALGITLAAPLCLMAGAAARFHLYRAFAAPHVVEFRNDSAADVVAASAAVCGSEVRLTHLAAGGTARARVHVDCSGAYRLRVTRASGEVLQADGVGFHWYAASQDMFILTGDGQLLHREGSS